MTSMVLIFDLYYDLYNVNGLFNNTPNFKKKTPKKLLF